MRCNATQTAIDYAEQHQLLYGGELFPMYVSHKAEVPTTNYKILNHEVKIQPNFDVELFVEQWSMLNSPNIIYLIRTRQALPVFDNATMYLTRRNVRSMLYAWVDYNIAAIEGAGSIPAWHFFATMLRVEMIYLLAMAYHCNKNNKQITWYEDIYGVEPILNRNLYPNVASLPYASELKLFIDNLVKDSKIFEYNEGFTV